MYGKVASIDAVLGLTIIIHLHIIDYLNMQNALNYCCVMIAHEFPEPELDRQLKRIQASFTLIHNTYKRLPCHFDKNNEKQKIKKKHIKRYK